MIDKADLYGHTELGYAVTGVGVLLRVIVAWCVRIGNCAVSHAIMYLYMPNWVDGIVLPIRKYRMAAVLPFNSQSLGSVLPRLVISKVYVIATEVFCSLRGMID